MITIDFIKTNSKEHGPLGGKQTVLHNEKYILSIVGGRSGLYGDFENDFEMAVIDPVTKEFITKLFFDNLSDEVIPYAEPEEVERVANLLFKDDFQVR
jgi:hypothetical protein